MTPCPDWYHQGGRPRPMARTAEIRCIAGRKSGRWLTILPVGLPLRSLTHEGMLVKPDGAMPITVHCP